jgi:hypothetical protein
VIVRSDGYTDLFPEETPMSAECFCPNPSCRKRFKVPPAKAGKRVKCTACGQTFTATDSATTEAPLAATVATVVTALGRFVVGEKLGAGAFGTVYRAYDPQLDREVALKVPNAGVMTDPKRAERFLREAKAAANLRHPHIVPVFDAGQDGDRYFIASAFIDGKRLSDAIPEGGMEFTRAARLVRELADALAYAHEQGIVHRDVKPSNIMLDKYDHVHLMDFGLAVRQEEESRLTADGAVVGTAAYMSPEQARGQTDNPQPATDQYAAGVVLYELLTGAVPFKGPTTVVLHNVIHVEPDSPQKRRAGVPKDLETICLKAMAKSPEDRYPGCQALADDLRRWLEGEPISARRMTFVERLTRWIESEPKLVGAATATMAVLLVSIVLLSVNTRRMDEARRQAERDATEARAARSLAAEEQKKAQTAAEREELAAAGKLDALGTAVQERKRAESFQQRAAETIKEAEGLHTLLTEEQEKVVAAHETAAKERLRANEFQMILSRWKPSQLAHWEVTAGRVASAQKLLALIPAEERGWEWHYLASACHPTGERLPKIGILSDDSRFVVSPDGSRIATFAEGPLKVWDNRTGAKVFSPEEPLSDLTPPKFSTDGTKIVASSSAGVRVWDANTGEMVLAIKGETHHASFSADGTKIVAVSNGSRAVTVWDAKTGAETLTLKRHPDLVSSVSFSADGSRILTVCQDKTVTVYDADTGKLRLALSRNKHNGFSAEVSPDGSRIITSDPNWGAKLWNAETGEEMQRLTEHGVDFASFSQSGKIVVGERLSRRLAVWDMKTGTKMCDFRDDTNAVSSALVNPNGSRVVTTSWGGR